jgi:hypothetical protein
MKGVFECLSQKYGGSYKLLSSMAGMIETSAASQMIITRGPVVDIDDVFGC